MSKLRIGTVHLGYAGKSFYEQLNDEGVKLVFQSIPFFQKIIWQSPDSTSNQVQRIELVNYFLDKVSNKEASRLAEMTIKPDLYNSFKSEILNNIQLFHLFDRSIHKGLSLGDRAVFCYSLYVEMIAFLKKQNVNIIIYGVYPHHPWDHVFRLTARILGIKQLFCNSYIVNGNGCFVFDDKDFAVPSKFGFTSKDSNLKSITINKHSKSVWKSQLLNLSSAPWNSSIKEVNRAFYGKQIDKIQNIDLTTILKYGTIMGTMFTPDICNHLGRFKIAVFYLHYEPEAATNPLGGIYWEQRVAILRLRQLLPESWLLILKDHPYFAVNQESIDNLRGPSFFDSLKGLGNTIYIDPFQSISSDSLISNSLLTVSLSGTVLFQSLFLQVPVLRLGITPPSCPGVLNDFTDNLEEDVIRLNLELRKIPYESILSTYENYTWPINPYGLESEVFDNTSLNYKAQEQLCVSALVKLTHIYGA